MPADINELSSDITMFLQSLRFAVDRPTRDRDIPGTGERERLTRTLLMIEEARIRFRSRVRFRPAARITEFEQAVDEVTAFLNDFLHSEVVNPATYDLPFRLSAPREPRTAFQKILAEEKYTIGDALIAFRMYLDEAQVPKTEGRPLNLKDLEHIVPRQQVAPVKFTISDNKIVIADRTPQTLAEDRGNIEAALDHLRGSGEKLIENLERSNCDRRLLENVKELHSQIVGQDNVVKLGLTNLACGVMCAQFADELPDALNAMISSFNTSVSMYVAQFPEWEQFTQKAASIDLGEDDIAEIDATASEVIASLEGRPDLADPAVPKTIKFLREFISSPGNSAKRAAFAMLRTLENLVSSIVRYSISALTKTAEQSVDKIAAVGSSAVVALLGVALVGAAGISVASATAGTPWVKQAAEVVQKQIESLSPS